MTHDYKRNGTTTLFAAFDIERGDFSGAIEALAPLAGQTIVLAATVHSTT
jgi:hypothetical protein